METPWSRDGGTRNGDVLSLSVRWKTKTNFCSRYSTTSPIFDAHVTVFFVSIDSPMHVLLTPNSRLSRKVSKNHFVAGGNTRHWPLPRDTPAPRRLSPCTASSL